MRGIYKLLRGDSYLPVLWFSIPTCMSFYSKTLKYFEEAKLHFLVEEEAGMHFQKKHSWKEANARIALSS